MDPDELNEAGRMKTALMLTIVGLVIEVFCLWEVTPGSFVAFAAIGVPLIGIGLLVFLHTVWKVLRRAGGL